MKLLRIFAAAALLAGVGFAQLARTTITDTVYDLAGNPATGSVTIESADTFTSADGHIVAAGTSITVPLVSGQLDVALVPNAGSAPAGSYYIAVYHLLPNDSFEEDWIVPSSTSPVQLTAVRALLPPSLGLLFAYSQIEPPANCIALGGFVQDTAAGWTCNSSAGGGVTTFNGRAGVVVPAAGDYSFGLLSGSAALGQLPGSGAVTINAAAPLSGGGSVSLGGALDLACASCITAIPAPTSSTLGGAEAYTAPAHEFVTGLGTNGQLTAAQASFSDIANALADAQLPADAVRSTGAITAGDCAAWSSSDIARDAGGPCLLAAPVTSVFGRTGAVVAATGDYSFSQISGTAATSQIPWATPGNIGSTTAADGYFAALFGAALPDCSAATADKLLYTKSTGLFSCGTDQTASGSGGGTVTSVAMTVPSWLAVGGSPVTSAGTLAVAGATGLTAHEILGTGTSGALALEALELGDLPTGCSGCVLLGQGSGAAPAYVADPEVQGVQANGSAQSGNNPVPVAGADSGGFVRQFLTDSNGRLYVNVNGTVPVSGTFWQSTQPVSLASLPALAAGSNDIGTIGNTSFAATQSSGANLHADIDNFPATQPVSGTVTANAGTGFPVVPTASAAVNDSASGLTQVVAAASGKSIYVTGYTVVTAAAVSVQWEYGTGTACGTGTTALTGPMSFAANGGAAAHQTLFVPSGDALCLNLSAAVQVGGSVSYAQQ